MRSVFTKLRSASSAQFGEIVKRRGYVRQSMVMRECLHLVSHWKKISKKYLYHVPPDVLTFKGIMAT